MLPVTVARNLITTVLPRIGGLRCSRFSAMAEPMDVDGPRGVKRKADNVDVTNSRRIKALDPDVINKIAAGEIIVAPVHALKELIENAVDAGSTALEVLAKDGGLKLLQITDNGSGIDVCFSNPLLFLFLRFFPKQKDRVPSLMIATTEQASDSSIERRLAHPVRAFYYIQAAEI